MLEFNISLLLLILSPILVAPGIEGKLNDTIIKDADINFYSSQRASDFTLIPEIRGFLSKVDTTDAASERTLFLWLRTLFWRIFRRIKATNPVGVSSLTNVNGAASSPTLPVAPPPAAALIPSIAAIAFPIASVVSAVVPILPDPILPPFLLTSELTSPPVCAATANNSPQITVTVPTATSCVSTLPGDNNLVSCARATSAQSGNFSVEFQQPGPSTSLRNSPAVVVGIVASCPNTKITLECDLIPRNYIVLTTTQTLTNGKREIQAGEATITEKKFMQVRISQRTNNANQVRAVPTNITCSWLAS